MLFVGLLGGCVWDMVQSPEARTLQAGSFVAACIVFAVAAGGLGVFFLWHKESELEDILGGAKDDQKQQL
jgi:hypothetical protein